MVSSDRVGPFETSCAAGSAATSAVHELLSACSAPSACWSASCARELPPKVTLPFPSRVRAAAPPSAKRTTAPAATAAPAGTSDGSW